jgi:hypothetical protein
MSKVQDYYVYSHSTEKHGIFYVGKGNKNRIKTIHRKSNPYHTRIVNKYGKENIIVRSMLCKSEQHALDLEVKLIAALRAGGVKLVNLTDGGEGMSGYNHSDETKAKIGAAHRGKVVSEETRVKLSEIGKNISEETRAKMSARTHSEETKAKISASWSEERKVEKSLESIAKSTAKNTGKKRSDEYKARMSELGKLRHLNNKELVKQE